MSNKLAKPMANKIVVDDGSKVYTIENKRGKVLGKFEFRPTDTNIVKRYEEVLNTTIHISCRRIQAKRI